MLVYSKCGKITIEFKQTGVLGVILRLPSDCKRKENVWKMADWLLSKALHAQLQVTVFCERLRFREKDGKQVLLNPTF